MKTTPIPTLAIAALAAAAFTQAPVAHADDPVPISPTAIAAAAAANAVATANDATHLRLTLGGAFTAGNTQSATFSTAGTFTHRRRIHLLTLEHAINRGFTSVPGMPPTTSNVPANYLARARYDVFLNDWLSLFAVLQAYRDSPQGFWSQEMVQLGPSFTIVNIPTRRRWWAEVAGSVAYENLTSPTPSTPMNPPYEHYLGLARLFTGYEEQATPLFSFRAGIEALMNVENANDVRLSGNFNATSRISALFSLGFNLQAHYLTQPVGGKEPWDILGTLSLVVENGWTPHPPAPAPVPTVLSMPVTEPISGEGMVGGATASSSLPPPLSAAPSPAPAPATR